jgi:hypothetical protein
VSSRRSLIREFRCQQCTLNVRPRPSLGVSQALAGRLDVILGIMTELPPNLRQEAVTLVLVGFNRKGRSRGDLGPRDSCNLSSNHRKKRYQLTTTQLVVFALVIGPTHRGKC